MEIRDKTVLVLGGAGLVGSAVCRELLTHAPATIVVAARRRERACDGADRLRAEFPGSAARIVPTWGDVFLRAAWQTDGPIARATVLDDTEMRRRFLADIFDPLDEEIIAASLLTRLVTGEAAGLDGTPADTVVDCMNTATAVSYQNVYAASSRVAELAISAASDTDWPQEVERLLATLYVPQLVRHVQLLNEALRRAGTRAYVKVGTSGSGGMGLNIPYTHGEEKPSRMLLSKAAVAGAQTLLTFLMARTPGGPDIVKEIKPTACIGWRAIEHGPIHVGAEPVACYDCPPDKAVSRHDPGSLAAKGEFGSPTGHALDGVYIDTGENGQFSADEFAVITAPGQMQLVTAEEIARNVVAEITGGNTGRDVIAALDGAVMGPTYRGGHLRQTALKRLRQLEAEHGAGVAFEMLGPPRLSKLLFEAHLLARCCHSMSAVLSAAPEDLAVSLEKTILEDGALRARIVSIGIPVLLSDGVQLLRGPACKADDPHHGWVDLTVPNMRLWQQRLARVREQVAREIGADTSSRCDRVSSASSAWHDGDALDVAATVAWIMTFEEHGARQKS